MSEDRIDTLLEEVWRAFADVPKPSPLSPLEGSCEVEESIRFNELDWATATSKDYYENIEGAICIEVDGFRFLTPRLLRMAVNKTFGLDLGDDIEGDVILRLLDQNLGKELLESLFDRQFLSLDEFFKYRDTKRVATDHALKELLLVFKSERVRRNLPDRSGFTLK